MNMFNLLPVVIDCEMAACSICKGCRGCDGGCQGCDTTSTGKPPEEQ